MQVRKMSEIQSLDDELNLFEETEWDFMSIVDTHGSNYEYFNDIRDTDFDFRKGKSFETFMYVACFFVTLFIMTGIALRVTNFFDHSEYDAVKGIQSMHSGVGVTYISEGTEATAEDLVEVYRVLNDYTNCLQSRSDYRGLDKLCASDSKFAAKYYEYTGKVNTIYDVNDCYARGLREFASYYRIIRINNVVEKDAIYYCYVTVEYPSVYDVIEFVQMYQQSFVLKFQGGSNISEATVAKFLLEVIADEHNYMPRSSGDTCIQMRKQDGNMVLSDDSFILSYSSADYSTAVNQLLASLSGLLTSNRE